MKNEDYELHLLKNVQWWLYINSVRNFSDDVRLCCYHGDVFGVHTVMEVTDLEKMAKKHNLEIPGCIVGG